MIESDVILYAKRNFGNSIFNALCRKLERKEKLSKHEKQLDSFLNECCIRFNLSKNRITKEIESDVK